jgi:hypothetical protein
LHILLSLMLIIIKGYITSDCGAVDGVMNQHMYTNTTDATCAAVFDAGGRVGCVS